MWKNLKIGYKYFSALIFTVFLFSIGALLMFNLLSISISATEEVDRRGKDTILIANTKNLFEQKDNAIANYIITKDEQYLNEYERLVTVYEETEKELYLVIDTDEEQQLLAEVEGIDHHVVDLYEDEIIPMIKQNMLNDQEMIEIRKELNELKQEVFIRLEKISSSIIEEKNEAIMNAKSSLNNAIKTFILSMIGSALIGGIIMYFINKKVSHNLNQLVIHCNEISQGNLSIGKIVNDSDDEVGKLVKSVNKMSVSLRTLISEISNTSIELAAHSEQLYHSTECVKEGGNQISQAMNDLAIGATEQANSSSDLAENVQVLSSKLNEANRESESISEDSNNLLSLTKKGNDLMNSTIEKMYIIDEIVTESVQKVTGLEQKTSEINKIINVIKEISEQTNLLALNASIEAARAGEKGRGFAVVAAEVRKLAEQVSKSVEEITQIVRGIQLETNGVTKALSTGYTEIKSGVTSIQVTEETFKVINREINEMMNGLNDISNTIEGVSQNTININEDIHNISCVAEQYAAGIQETTATMEDSNVAIQEIMKSSEDLANLAEKLTTTVQKFSI